MSDETDELEEPSPRRRREDFLGAAPSSWYRAAVLLLITGGGGGYAWSSSNKLDDVKLLATDLHGDVEQLKKRTSSVEQAQERVDPTTARQVEQLQKQVDELTRIMTEQTREFARLAGQVEAMRGEVRRGNGHGIGR